MGGAINRPFISAHFLLSAYFLTAQTYKRMHLITRVYGICKCGITLCYLYCVQKSNIIVSIKACVHHAAQLSNFKAKPERLT